MLLHPIRSGFFSRSSVVLLNAVPELPPELATVSLPLLSSRTNVGRFFALLFPTAAVVRRHEVGANGEPLSASTDRWTDGTDEYVAFRWCRVSP